MATPTASASSIDVLRRLEHGDHLTRAEFERRYDQMPHLKKAELIEGVVYMPPPVSNEGHGAPHADFMGWLAYYRWHTPGVEAADNSTVRLDWDNEPQPDAMLRVLPECGGQSRDEDGYVALAPEWVGEVAASSTSYDLHEKKKVYRRNGVREYLVWRVADRAIDWFVLRGGRYDSLAAGNDGIYRSEVFPGLWLDAAALLAGDMRRVLAVLQQGIESPPHAEFVAQLAARRRT
jgi:Uma2 family endonuclease